MTRKRRAGEPVFDAVIDLEGCNVAEGGQEQGWRWRVTVVTDVRGVVDELLATGAVSRPEMRMPLTKDEEDVGLDEVGGWVGIR